MDNDRYKQKMQRRKEVQEQRLAERSQEKGLIIVHTGNGKGKTTAALGMVLRSLGHGYRVAIVQFIKGAWEPAEKEIFGRFSEQLVLRRWGRDLLGKPKIAIATLPKPQQHGKPP
jgi:cob(I)alamin adenosyltransferase